jgi:hypothetical protein
VPAGARVTFHVWWPAGAPISAIQPYVQQNAAGNWAWTGNWQSTANLKPGNWNTLTVQVPSNAAPLSGLGVVFTKTGTAATTAYIDSVSY